MCCMTFEGSKTQKNLMDTYAGECKARTRYDLYAKIAAKEGYVHVEKIFRETADNEFVHAGIMARYLGMRDHPTAENLTISAGLEAHEAHEYYKQCAADARAEGFADIATFYQELAEVEEEHEKRFTRLATRLTDGSMFKREESVRWHCLNCGYVHEGPDAPDLCPACKHPRAYFEVHCEEN